MHSELTSSSGRVIPLGVYARKSLFEYLDADYIFDKTRKGFAYYEEKFGYPYPFAKYDQLFVPEFNAGAMENAGAVTFTETYVFRSKVTDAIKERRVVTILHELAHMWFGDLVTMRWWNDLWLNESFAEWASTIATAEATEWNEAWSTFQSMEKSWAYRQDQLPSTHPVVATINDLEDVQVNFDGITYAKGGSVLKQLAAWVGIEAFFAGVGAYFRKHEYGNTELADLLAELEVTSGRELSGWGAQWLETAGVNTLGPRSRPTRAASSRRSASCRRRTRTTRRSGRTGSPSGSTSSPDDGSHERRPLARSWCAPTASSSTSTARSTEVDELLGLAKPNLVLLNDDDLAYAKIRMDDESFDTAVANLADIEDPLARALVWGSAWDSTRDGEVAPSDYVDLVLGNIATETESTTIRLSLTQLAQVARTYVAPEKQDATIRRVGDALWQLAQEAEAGSDAQFQFVKFFANLASTSEHGDVLAALRSRIDQPDGLEIDTDLSWELLEGLVLVGQAGEAEIAEALEADNTSNGQQAAARARATIATPEGKLAAMDAALTDASIPNVVLRNMGLGFQHVNDAASLEATVARYFDAIATDLEGPQLLDRELHPAVLLPRTARLAGARRRDERVARREPRRPGAAPPRRREPRGRRARAGRAGAGPAGLMELMRLGDAGAETPVVRVDGADVLDRVADRRHRRRVPRGGRHRRGCATPVAAGHAAGVRGDGRARRRADRAARCAILCIGQNYAATRPSRAARLPSTPSCSTSTRTRSSGPDDDIARTARRDPGRLGGRARRGHRHAGALPRLARGRAEARRRVRRQQRRVGAALPARHLGRPVVEGQERRDVQPARPGARPRRRGGPAGLSIWSRSTASRVRTRRPPT